MVQYWLCTPAALLAYLYWQIPITIRTAQNGYVVTCTTALRCWIQIPIPTAGYRNRTEIGIRICECEQAISVLALVFKNVLRFYETYLLNMQFRVLLCTALYFHVGFLYYSLHINNGFLADTEINTHISTETKRSFLLVESGYLYFQILQFSGTILVY